MSYFHAPRTTLLLITDNRTIKDLSRLHTVQFGAFELGQLKIAIAVLVYKLILLIER